MKAFSDWDQYVADIMNETDKDSDGYDIGHQVAWRDAKVHEMV